MSLEVKDVASIKPCGRILIIRGMEKGHDEQSAAVSRLPLKQVPCYF